MIGWSLAGPVPGRLAEPELVEGADGQRVEQAARRGRAGSGPAVRGAKARAPVGTRRRRCGRSSSLAWSPRVSTDRPEPAPAATGSRSTPPSSGSGRRRSSIRAMHVVEVGGPLGVDQHVAVSTGIICRVASSDDAGEAHAAGGGPEHVGVGSRRDHVRSPVGVTSVMARTWEQKRAVDVVVLAVDVGGDGARRRSRAGCPG